MCLAPFHAHIVMSNIQAEREVSSALELDINRNAFQIVQMVRSTQYVYKLFYSNRKWSVLLAPGMQIDRFICAKEKKTQPRMK